MEINRQDKSARQTKAGKCKTSLTKHLKPKDKTKTKDPLRRLQTKEEFPHFRYYKKSKHPALIVGEIENKDKSKEEYKYRKVMHSNRDGRNGRLNEMVTPNPKKTTLCQCI